MKTKIGVEEVHTYDLLKVNFLKDQRIMKALEEAHDDYMKRKSEVITKLYTIWKNDEVPSVYREWIKQAARFINEEGV